MSESTGTRAVISTGLVRTIALQVIAVVVIAGAAHLLPGLVVPPMVGLVLAIALSPVARGMERRGLPAKFSSLICTTVVGIVVTILVGLLVYQAGTMMQELIRQIDRLSQLLADATRQTGGGPFLESLGATGPKVSSDSPDGGASPSSAAYWEVVVRRLLLGLSDWLFSGIGGVLGFIAGAIAALLVLFELLRRRDEWVEHLLHLSHRIGLRPNRDELDSLRNQIVTYLGFLSIIAPSYFVLISTIFWWIGMPNPVLWGVLTGMLEYIPIFGPLVSGSLATVGSLAMGSAWKTSLVVILYVTLHTFEGYIIWPMVFSRTIRFDQVTILLGILFFGWLLGPIGPVLGLPLTILLRGLVVVSPETPALDATFGVSDHDQEKSTR